MGRQRLILLNWLVSSSKTLAKNADPPSHSGFELLKILDHLRQKKTAIEFFGADRGEDEASRIANGAGHDFVRLRQLKFEETQKWRYATLLIEFVDQSVKSFPVVHTKTYSGRELEGEEEERGATAAHVVVRLPNDGKQDDGRYRCAVEAVPSLSRFDVETLLNRQLRRYARDQDWLFTVVVHEKGKKPSTKEYKYHARLDFLADVGRKLNFGGANKELSYMLFTKRSEKQNIAQPTELKHRDVLADVEIKISAAQAPTDPAEKRTWFDTIREAYADRGFTTRLFYRHVSGRTVSGDVIHKDLHGAADLLMCPKEPILMTEDPKRWRSKIDGYIAKKMKELVDRDELWQQLNDDTGA